MRRDVVRMSEKGSVVIPVEPAFSGLTLVIKKLGDDQKQDQL